MYVIDADVQIKLREYVWLSWVKTSNHIKLLSIEYILLENEIIIEQETNSWATILEKKEKYAFLLVKPFFMNCIVLYKINNIIIQPGFKESG